MSINLKEKTMTTTLVINNDALSALIKSNIACYFNKSLTQELIDTLTKQIVDSIDYFIDSTNEIL